MRAVMLGLILVAIGCVAPTTTSWEGKHREELTQAWGPPEKELPLPGGGAKMVYIRGVVSGSMDYMCQVIFETDPDGRIRSQSYYGCP